MGAWLVEMIQVGKFMWVSLDKKRAVDEAAFAFALYVRDESTSDEEASFIRVGLGDAEAAEAWLAGKKAEAIRAWKAKDADADIEQPEFARPDPQNNSPASHPIGHLGFDGK